MIDQGLFAISNFALGILLARWLAPEEFGAFTVAYSLFLLFGTAHTALLTEPMLVFGSGRYAASFPKYLGVLARGHWVLTAAGACLLALAAAAAWFAGSVLLAQALLAVALAAPFILLSWLLRRACFACVQPQHAAAGGSVYLGLMLLGSYLLYRGGSLSVATAMAVVGASSLAAALWIAGRLRSHRGEGDRFADSHEVLAEHWAYGRWALASSLLAWVPGNIYFLVLPLTGGLQSAAAFKAVMNLLMPIMHATTALAMLLVPALVRAGGTGWKAFRSVLVRAAGSLVLAALLYWLLIGSLSNAAIEWLYAGRYTEYAHLLWFAGAIPVLTVSVNVLGSALRALERPNLIFRAYAVGTAATIALGIALVAFAGINGAVLGMMIAYGTTAALLLRQLRQARRDIAAFEPMAR